MFQPLDFIPITSVKMGAILDKNDTMPNYSTLDKFIMQIDTVVQTLLPPRHRPTRRSTPGADLPESTLDSKDKKHIAGLMRVNHSGEVSAQALYQGQAFTAQLPLVREKMNEAALEEVDHLGWCESRLNELNATTSFLNPIWYTLSFTIGATAGLIGDKWSLGFVAETERQVTAHLESHLKQIPSKDQKTRAILSQMAIDETQHATHAIDAGGAELPFFIKVLMQYMSKVMTHSSYYL